MWIIKFSSDGSENGPYTDDQIKSYIEDGRVRPDTRLRPVDADTWVTVSEVFPPQDELAEAAGAERDFNELTDTFDLSGGATMLGTAAAQAPTAPSISDSLDDTLSGGQTVMPQSNQGDVGDTSGTGGMPEVLGGCRIIEKIGSGGMGEVYLAEQESLGREVALKVIRVDMADDPDFKARFDREAKTLADLNADGIVKIFDKGITGCWTYFAMECVKDANGRAVSVADVLKDGPMDEALVAALAVRILDALKVAHASGVTHRDLKPANILIDDKGRPKIVDFGIAGLRAAGDAGDGLTRSGEAMGTPAYMAPEQFSDAASAGAPADIYAFGATIYRMLTGVLPRGAFEPPSQARKGLDPAWDQIVETCLKRRPEDRYDSADAVLADFARFKERLLKRLGEFDDEVGARLGGGMSRGRRIRYAIAASALILVGFLAFWGYGAWMASQEQAAWESVADAISYDDSKDAGGEAATHVAALQSFLSEWPDSSHAAKATERVAYLQGRPEHWAWQKLVKDTANYDGALDDGAKVSGLLLSVNKFKTDHPSSKQLAAATALHDRIARIPATLHWKRLRPALDFSSDARADRSRADTHQTAIKGFLAADFPAPPSNAKITEAQGRQRWLEGAIAWMDLGEAVDASTALDEDAVARWTSTVSGYKDRHPEPDAQARADKRTRELNDLRANVAWATRKLLDQGRGQAFTYARFDESQIDILLRNLREYADQFPASAHLQRCKDRINSLATTKANLPQLRALDQPALKRALSENTSLETLDPKTLEESHALLNKHLADFPDGLPEKNQEIRVRMTAIQQALPLARSTGAKTRFSAALAAGDLKALRDLKERVASIDDGESRKLLADYLLLEATEQWKTGAVLTARNHSGSDADGCERHAKTLDAYVRSYPAGPHRSDAETLAAELRDRPGEKAFNNLSTEMTSEPTDKGSTSAWLTKLRQYRNDYPEHRRKGDVDARIARLDSFMADVRRREAAEAAAAVAARNVVPPAEKPFVRGIAPEGFEKYYDVRDDLVDDHQRVDVKKMYLGWIAPQSKDNSRVIHPVGYAKASWKKGGSAQFFGAEWGPRKAGDVPGQGRTTFGSRGASPGSDTPFAPQPWRTGLSDAEKDELTGFGTTLASLFFYGAPWLDPRDLNTHEDNWKKLSRYGYQVKTPRFGTTTMKFTMTPPSSGRFSKGKVKGLPEKVEVFGADGKPVVTYSDIEWTGKSPTYYFNKCRITADGDEWRLRVGRNQIAGKRLPLQLMIRKVRGYQGQGYNRTPVYGHGWAFFTKTDQNHIFIQ